MPDTVVPTGLEPKTEDAVIRMKHFKDHKHVIRYQATDKDAVISDVYVSKAFARPMPSEIIITVAKT